MRRMQRSWADTIGRRYFKPVGGAILAFFAGETLGMIFNSWPPIIAGFVLGAALYVWGAWPEWKRKRNKLVAVDANPIPFEMSASSAVGRAGKPKWWRRLIPW